jgi:hypothetical protein
MITIHDKSLFPGSQFLTWYCCYSSAMGSCEGRESTSSASTFRVPATSCTPERQEIYATQSFITDDFSPSVDLHHV